MINTNELYLDLDIRDCKLKGYELAKYADTKANESQAPIIKKHPDRLIVTTDQYDELCDVLGAEKDKRSGMMFYTKLGFIMEVVEQND